MGGRKLWRRLKCECRQHGVPCIGRDRFFAILRHYKLLLEPRKAQMPRTTYSGHAYAVQPNLIKNIVATAPHQIFVSDVTYIRTGSGFSYLFLVTDAYSRKIVGFHLARTLEARGAVIALQMARQSIDKATGTIHHSDRGVQYCCHEFLDALRLLGMRSSMTDADHCAQNALAERMNGILKNEFYLDLDFPSYEIAGQAVGQAIMLYNSERPHGSLNDLTPDAFHHSAIAA
jgi:putative transposase